MFQSPVSIFFSQTLRVVNRNFSLNLLVKKRNHRHDISISTFFLGVLKSKSAKLNFITASEKRHRKATILLLLANLFGLA